jgi:hypothetical protein
VGTRAFAYNPTEATISGTINSKKLCIGVSALDYSSKPGGLKWWMGPEESGSYVIAKDVPTEDFPTQLHTLGPPTPYPYVGGVQFWRCSNTDEAFRSTVQTISGIAQASASNASTWLSENGYWTNWVQPYTAGLYKTTYSGYFNDVPDFFTTATPASVGGNPATSVQTTAITEPATDDGSNFSCQWLGYFKPTTTETYTFFTTSDDASYVWVGATAVSGFTTANAVVNNGGLHGSQEASGTIALTAGVYYPIRIQFGELNGGDVMTFNYSTPTITKTTTVTGLVLYNNTTNGF